MSDELEKKIDNMEWTLFDRFLYGGLGHGYLCLPTNLIRILFTVIFPPLGTILRYLKISSTFPYITMETLVHLFRNIDDIIYAFVLTALFYIPGLIYGLSSLKCAETENQDKESMEDLAEVSMSDIKDHFYDIKKKKSLHLKES